MRTRRMTVADLRAAKGHRALTMLYVETPDEAAAAAAAGVDILSIIAPVWTDTMREAAGDCFVQVGLLYGGPISTDDYLRAGFAALKTGGDAFYCSAALETVRRMAAEGLPVVGHVGLVPHKATWTGGFKAVGKTAASALSVWRAMEELEAAGAVAVELEVVPARIGAELSRRSSLVTLGMGAGSGTDAQYLFAEDVLGCTRGHRPRHAKTYRNFAAEYERLQQERIDAFGEFVADVKAGRYPGPEHDVAVDETEFAAFIAGLDPV
ncbi:3-methyl-2-oxobutanoate hydroxymethyltransferase [Tabrizicola sp. BL-A-41-H6]|uniref:3-methyl-2-oxobutanoate hydroxymethyltransferase n=1 Tax=Tabrizicola sp. BL-A-41-H6 TaxID=3421107 RepID=UPI003D67DA47